MAERMGGAPGERGPRQVGFGELLRTSFVLCLATGALALLAFALYQLWVWLF
jgi:hypothetical protein